MPPHPHLISVDLALPSQKANACQPTSRACCFLPSTQGFLSPPGLHHSSWALRFLPTDTLKHQAPRAFPILPRSHPWSLQDKRKRQVSGEKCRYTHSCRDKNLHCKGKITKGKKGFLYKQQKGLSQDLVHFSLSLTHSHCTSHHTAFKESSSEASPESLPPPS